MTGLIEIVLRNGLRRYWTKGQFAGSTICVFFGLQLQSTAGAVRSIVSEYLLQLLQKRHEKIA
jgi:hypothetical protein